MHNATNSATKHVSMNLEHIYEEQLQMQNPLHEDSKLKMAW